MTSDTPENTETDPVETLPRNRTKKTKTRADDEIDAAISRSKVKEKKDSLKKRRLKFGVILSVIALLGYGIYFLFIPYQGTMAFGICKVFLELNTQYPKTMRLSTVEELGMSVRIWYTQIDSFGEYRLEPLQCYFKPDDTSGFILDKVTLNRREVDPLLVSEFNKSIPTILAYPPDLTLPVPLPDSLQDLQIDTNLFRKQIFQRPAQ